MAQLNDTVITGSLAVSNCIYGSVTCATNATTATNACKGWNGSTFASFGSNAFNSTAFTTCTGTVTSINIYCGTTCKCGITSSGSICLGSNAFNSTAFTTCTGTVTSIAFQCAGTAKSTITSSGTINLSANAWNTYATISTTTYPGACCTGTLTSSSGCYGCAYYVRSSELRYFAVWTTGATASCNVYKALCTAVGGNLVSVFGEKPNAVNGRIFDFGNNCWYESHLLMVCSATCVRVAITTTGYGAWLTSTCTTNLAAGVKIQGIY